MPTLNEQRNLYLLQIVDGGMGEKVQKMFKIFEPPQFGLISLKIRVCGRN
jgi:hypothetical protein